MKKIGFQGEHGAYSEQAIFTYFGKKVKTIPLYSFEDIFLAVDKKKIDLGFVPIENFLAGSIVQTYDLLLKYDVYIIGEILLPIHHNLIANKNATLKDIKNVYSHPQALAQCHDFIQKHSFNPKEDYDTAGSVRNLKKENLIENAAIASKIAAEIYGMKILAKNIESVKNNTTRFIIISKKEIKEKKKNVSYLTSMIFSVSGVPAALYKCLGGFATNGVNLVKIESRPMRGKIREYLFYIDVEGHQDEISLKHALKELEYFSSSFKLLGSYPK